MKFKRFVRGVVVLVRGIAIAVVATVVVGVVLYLFGLRVVMDGGAGMSFAFVKSAEAQAEEIARHRAAQRAQSPTPPPAAAPAGPSASASASAPASPAAVSAAPSAVPAAAVISSTYWTQFRGPNGQGHYDQQPIRTDWPSGGLTPLWKQPVGGGYASFVIAGGHAFTIEQRGAEEVAAAYDLATGRELWASGWTAMFQLPMGDRDGPRATPTWHDGRLYVLGATGEFRALDAATGRTLWRTDILADAGAQNIEYGLSAAPLVVDDTVVVMPGGANGQSVIAYDRHSGKRVWAALDDRASYSSPMLVTLAGVRQIVVFTARRLVGLAPENGSVFWEFPWRTQNDVASQPLIAGPDRVFISTGFGGDAAMLQLAAAAGGQLTVRELWRTHRMNNVFSSSVVHDGFIYGLDESILACIDASTGELKWKGGRYGFGQVMLASGHLIVLTEEGELALVRADPAAHQEIVRFPAIEGKTWNQPAMSDGVLLIRNIEEMAAFDLTKGPK
jgi:outer membrane protein assembly factor BamB